MGYYTKTFKLKELFTSFYNFTEIRDKYIVEPVNATETEQEIVYRLIFNDFCNCSVAFDTPNAFYRHFFLEYWNCCDEFVKRLNVIKQLRNLTLDEFKKEVESITNVANNDNAIVESPLTEIIPYITSQSSSVSRTNSAVAYARAISMYRDNEVNNFLRKFKKLFLQVHGDYGIIYT